MHSWLLLLAVLVPGSMGGIEASRSTIEQDYDKIYALNMADTGTDNELKGRQIGAYYDAHLARFQEDTVLAGRSDAEVDLLFQSAFLAGFYTYDEKYLDDMRSDVAEFGRRGRVPEKVQVDFYHSLVAQRRFDEATRFQQAHPDAKLSALPIVHDDLPKDFRGPTGLYLVDSKSDRSFHRRVLPLTTSSAHVVVISHPKCHFSRNAVADIERSDTLLPIFQAHSIWITPQDGNIDVASLAAWNQAHRIPPTAVSYRQSEWPMFHNWATPTFYFFKDGKLVREVSGWPANGNHEALNAALREVGLLD